MCEKSFLPPLHPAQRPHEPPGQTPLTWRNRQLGKINLPSCLVGPNGILILLQEEGGRDLWWAAVTGST